MHLEKMCSVCTTWHASTFTYVAGLTGPACHPSSLSGRAKLNPNGGFHNLAPRGVLGTDAPVMLPNGVEFALLFFLTTVIMLSD